MAGLGASAATFPIRIADVTGSGRCSRVVGTRELLLTPLAGHTLFSSENELQTGIFCTFISEFSLQSSPSPAGVLLT